MSCVISLIVRFWSYVYTLRVTNWIERKRTSLYTLWISHFIGAVGEGTNIHVPLILQGGGQRRIKIGSHTGIGQHTVLGCWEHYGKDEHFKPEIVIGDHCSIGDYCHITAIRKITIGDGLLTGRFVYIGDNSHGVLSLEDADIPPSKRKLQSKGEISIGKNVWIGDKVSIFGGVTIGNNVIIGAGSIVTHDIPSNSMAVGAPAKVVKTV